MNQWIKEKLREGLKDMNMSPTIYQPGGKEHKIYQSKSNPNVLYKVGSKENVIRWVNIFKKYPKLFPTVFRVGRMKNDPTECYAEVEKLDTQKVLQEWWNMDEILEKTPIYKEFGVEVIDELFRTVLWDEGVDNQVVTKIKQYAPKIYSLFIKWVNFLHGLESVVTEAKDNGVGADIHRGNFAYDKSGNIKCIDI